MTPEEKKLKDALKKYLKRKTENAGKQINNTTLYAGSPMYFYCKHCGVLTDKLPETYVTPPKTCCDDCKELEKLGGFDTIFP